MLIAAYNKCSMIDYDGHMAAVVFTKGCQMTCPYCHNKGLLDEENILSEEMIMNHLKSRVGMLEGVVISGGEPTLHADLPDFIIKVKSLGYLVKLDTNGTNTKMLKMLLEENLVDHIAMDIKCLPYQYETLTGVSYDKIKEAIFIVKSFGSYEFRHTAYPQVPYEDIETLCQIYKDEPFFIQQYRPQEKTDLPAYEDHFIQALGDKYGVKVRGIL